MSSDELLRWIESPSRRLLLLAYLGIAWMLLSMVLTVVWLFVRQRLVFTVLAKDTDYAYQLTHFFGSKRNFGYALMGTSKGRILKVILFGRTIIERKRLNEPSDPRKFRARLLLIVKDGSEASVRSSLFLRRIENRIDLDRLLFKLALGFEDPSLTGQAAGILYTVSNALPKGDDRYVAVVPMFDRTGADLEVEVSIGFRAFRVLIPWLKYVLHPAVLKFTWRWMFPRIVEETPVVAKEITRGRQVLWN